MSECEKNNRELSYPVRGTDNNYSTIFVLPSRLKTIHRLWSELELELIMIKNTEFYSPAKTRWAVLRKVWEMQMAIRLRATHNVPLVLSVVLARPCLEQRVQLINEDDARCKAICEALVWTSLIRNFEDVYLVLTKIALTNFSDSPT